MPGRPVLAVDRRDQLAGGRHGGKTKGDTRQMVVGSSLVGIWGKEFIQHF